MAEFLFDPHNAPFVWALGIMFAIALLEGVGALVGAGISSTIDALLPDTEIELDVPDAPHNVLSKFMGWMRIGKVPILIILVVFLTSFGLIGISIHSLTGLLLPNLIVGPAALFGSFFVTSYICKGIEKIFPKDETSAVSTDSFIGHVAILTLSEAVKGKAAEARLNDKHNQMHYVFVEPEEEGVVFKKGDEVLLTKMTAQNKFLAILNEHEQLSN